MPSAPNPVAYRFGPFRLSVADRILERDGKRIQLTPKVIDTLFVLLENAPQVITKEALMKAVWPDVNVVESGLTRNISALRKVLEAECDEGTFVETIPKRGYRFVADVEPEFEPRGEPEPAQEPAAAPPPTRRSKWMVPAIAATVLAVLGLAAVVRRPAIESKPIEPEVRIGEHLLYKLAPGETVQAVEHFERAIKTNPRSAGAHAGLAISLLHLSMLGVKSPREIMPRAAEMARRAIDLDPESSTAHYATACVRLILDWKFDAAAAEFRRSLELAPDSVQTRLAYIRLQIAIGDMDSAQRLAEEALRLDPASPPLGAEYCGVFYYRSDFRRAESECRKVLDREPGFGLARYYLALILGLSGRYDEAGQEFAKTGLMPGVLEADQAWLDLLRGDRAPALAVLESRRRLIREGKIDPSSTLLLATALGRRDEAFEALDAGVKIRAPELLTLVVDPRLQSLHPDPRFRDILRRMGLPSR